MRCHLYEYIYTQKTQHREAYPSGSALSFVMSTQNDQNLHWPMFSCPKKQACQNIDHRLKTAQYLLREHITRATIDLTATGAGGRGDHSIHTQSWCLDTQTGVGQTVELIPTHVQYLEPGRHGWCQLLVKRELHVSANIQTINFRHLVATLDTVPIL